MAETHRLSLLLDRSKRWLYITSFHVATFPSRYDHPISTHRGDTPHCSPFKVLLRSISLVAFQRSYPLACKARSSSLAKLTRSSHKPLDLSLGFKADFSKTLLKPIQSIRLANSIQDGLLLQRIHQLLRLQQRPRIRFENWNRCWYRHRCRAADHPLLDAGSQASPKTVHATACFDDSDVPEQPAAVVWVRSTLQRRLRSTESIRSAELRSAVVCATGRCTAVEWW